MNEKWFDECSVVAYPHEIRFLNSDGGSISYYVDRNVSEYVRKIQAQLNTLQNENRDKNIKNMILQSKLDKAIEFIKESNTYYEITHYIPENEKQFKIDMETLTNHLLNILKEEE